MIAALFVAALGLRLTWVQPTGFDGLYGQDAYAYAGFARDLAAGQPTGDLFWPLGYPLILSLGYTLFGLASGQVISLVMGALLSPLIYILTRQYALDRLSAAVAGLLMAFCGQAVQSSLVVMADIPALFWVTLSAIALMRYFRRDQPLFLVLSAGLLAFAAVTRWLYLLLALVWVASVLLHWGRRIRWRASLLAVVTALAVLLPQIYINRTSSLSHHWLPHYDLTNAARTHFTTDEGTFTYAQTNLHFYTAPLTNPYFLSRAFLPLVALGVLRLHRRVALSRQLLVLGWLLIPLLALMGFPAQNIRYPLIAVPPVMLLVGAGVAQVRLWRGWRLILPIALIVGIVQTAQVSEPIIRTFIDRQQQDRALVRAVDPHLPADASLYTFGLTLVFAHHTAHNTLAVYEIYYETPDSLRAKWIPGQTDYLLLNVWVIENQWQERTPQTVYHWFRDVRGLTPVRRWGNYTLFQIKG